MTLLFTSWTKLARILDYEKKGLGLIFGLSFGVFQMLVYQEEQRNLPDLPGTVMTLHIQ